MPRGNQVTGDGNRQQHSMPSINIIRICTDKMVNEDELEMDGNPKN